MKKFDISGLIITRIVDIYSHTVAQDTEADAVARHDLLIVKKKGRSTYTVGKEEFLADGEHMIYLPAGTAYSLYVDRVGECAVIEFDTLREGERGSAGAYFTDGESEIAAAVKNLLHYWTLRGPAYQSQCLSTLYGLLTQLSSIRSYTDSLAGKYSIIHRSVQYIEKYYHKQDLYTPMLAEMSGIGETYYRNIFIAVFGVPPTRYIQQYRVEKAKEQLVNSTRSVEEIAVGVGFANSSYFCKVFKTQTGMTPSEFAELGRQIG